MERAVYLSEQRQERAAGHDLLDAAQGVDHLGLFVIAQRMINRRHEVGDWDRVVFGVGSQIVALAVDLPPLKDRKSVV